MIRTLVFPPAKNEKPSAKLPEKLCASAPRAKAAFLHKCPNFHSTVALQGGFLKHLGDVATVLLDLVCLSLFCFFMSFQRD